MRRPHIAGIAVLLALIGAQVLMAAPATLAGVVRNRAGVPQTGARVQLLREDLSVAASATTDDHGRFLMTMLMPGHYSVKAVCESYLPTLRENVRIHAATVVNLTMSSLYEAIQWLPAEPKARSAQNDDWMWTLRSAANRPLLRWLEDGPLVVVQDGKGETPRLKARLMATGQEGAFGESGERITATLEVTPADSRELLARVDFAPNSDGARESMLGFRQDLGYAGSVQTVAAVSVQPEISSPEGSTLQEWMIKSWENAQLGPAVRAEVGTHAVIAHMDGGSTTTRVLPFAELSWQGDNQSLTYRITRFLAAHPDDDPASLLAAMPAVLTRNAQLSIAAGTHQELGWERTAHTTRVRVAVFGDQMDHTAIEAAAHLAAQDANGAGLDALLDSASGLIRAAAPDYSAAGVTASVERSLPAGNRVRLSYANGDALVVPAANLESTTLATLLASVRARRAQTCSLSLSGTLEGSGTRWRASYRWQPEDAVSVVAPYDEDAAEPYFSLHMRQPIRLGWGSDSSFELLMDVRNLLAQGYRPVLLNDGSLLLFANEQRGFRAGLAFRF